MPKVSIIVPIYNVEKYLSKCLDSLINQTLEEIEIVLVNDGSTDNSLSICIKYAAEDKRIKVIDIVNSGVSSARNEGIKAASGDYIGFVDPDDWIELDMYEKMHSRVVNDKSDVAICNYKMLYPDTEKLEICYDFKDNIIEGEMIIDYIVANLIGPKNLNSKSKAIMGSVWRLLINKEIIRNTNIQFPVGIPLMEDTIFTISTVLNSKKISTLEDSYYNYIVNTSSAVTSYRSNLGNIQSEVYSMIENILLHAGIMSRVQQRLNYRYFNDSINLIRNEINKDNKISIKNKIKNIKIICSDARLQKIISHLDYSEFTLNKKILIFIIRKKLSIEVFIYYTLIKTISV